MSMTLEDRQEVNSDIVMNWLFMLLISQCFTVALAVQINTILLITPWKELCNYMLQHTLTTTVVHRLMNLLSTQEA